MQQNSANPYQPPLAEASTKPVAAGDSNRVSVAERISATLLGICCMAASVTFAVLAGLTLRESATTSRLQFTLGIVLLISVVLNVLGVYFAIRHRPMLVLCLFLSSLGLLAVHVAVVWQAVMQ